MKKIKTYCDIIALLFFAASGLTHASETNWFSKKMDEFAKKMLTRHTYQKDSFEHFRDRALLLTFPQGIAQSVLYMQRQNMINFLKQNEENALQGIKNYLGYSEEKWSRVMKTIQEESEFNLNAMQHGENYDTFHDPELPKPWVAALKKECKRHDAKPENMNFRYFDEAYQTKAAAGCALVQGVNTIYLKKGSSILPKSIPLYAAHEMIHAVKNDGMIESIIQNEIVKTFTPTGLSNEYHRLLGIQGLASLVSWFDPFDFLNKQQIDKDLKHVEKKLADSQVFIVDEFLHSKSGENFIASVEKTADTWGCCIDPEIAQSAAYDINNVGKSYPANHNDMLVVADNWRTAQAVATLVSWRKMF